MCGSGSDCVEIGVRESGDGESVPGLLLKKEGRWVVQLFVYKERESREGKLSE